MKIEEKPILDTEDDDGALILKPSKLHALIKSFGTDGVLIELPVARPESYAFSVPLSSIYSLIVRPPSLSSWCKSFCSFKVVSR